MKIRVFSFVLMTLMVVATSKVYAVGSSGFENASFSAYALSQSNAVTAQPEEEPASISYNPAGIANLEGVQVQTNDSFVSVLTNINSASDSHSRSGGTFVPIPTAYLTVNPGAAFNDRLTLGIGSDSPFGLLNKYDSNHPATQFTGYKNWLKMYTLKPTVAFKVNDWLSLAAGAMNYRVFDFGGIQAYPNSFATGSPATAPGQVRLNLSGQGWGWHLGALIKAHRNQLGFYFRCPVNVKTKGLVKVENALVGNRFETGGWSRINFPLNMTLGYAYHITDKTTAELDLGYTHWGIYERQYIYTNPVDTANDAILSAIGQGAGNEKDYDDSFSIHLGGNHQLTDHLNLRAGSLFYTAAVPKTHFAPSVPDSNRLAFSLGAGYQLSKYAKIDLSYFYMLGLRRGINNDNSEHVLLPNATVDGRYTSHYNIITIGLTLMWEDIFDKLAKERKPAAEVSAAPKN